MKGFYGLAVFPAILALAAMSPSATLPEKLASAELTTPFAIASSAFCDGHCHECEEGGYTGHTFDLFTDDYWGDVHLCEVVLAGCGSANHGSCGVPADDGEEQGLFGAMVSVSDGEVDALVALLRDYPDVAQVNVARGYLQVSGTCSPDHVIAQAPLSDAQLDAVTDAS